jgi:hypothetical protein
MSDQERSVPTLSVSDVRELLDHVFEQEALVIGGLVALHEWDDDVVWRLIRSLDVIRGRVLRRLEEKARANIERPSRGPVLKPHPAIEGFLLSLRRA